MRTFAVVARWRWAVAVLVVAVVGGWTATSAPVAAAGDAAPRLVTYASAEAAEHATAEGGELDRADDESSVIAEQVAVAELTPTEEAALANRADVLAVEVDGVASLAEVPNDPCYVAPGSCFGTGAWHVNRVGLPSAWNVSHGEGVIIAVVDSGMAHPPIAEFAAPGKLLPEIDATGGTPACTSGSALYHGTATAALAAAATDNGIGIPGAGWDARIQPVRVWAGPSCGNDTAVSDLISGINHARLSGASVINVSLESGPSTAMQTAVANAVNEGIAFIAAAGNGSGTSPRYPAAYDGVISIGATTDQDTKASFSNHGAHVDLFAPGDDLVSLDRSGNLIQVSGTSFSAPIVAGVAALLRAARPSITATQIRDVLVATADPVNGLLHLNARAALHRAVFAGSPGAESVTPTSVDVASRGVDNSVWVRTLDSGRWVSLGGIAQHDPDLASTADGRLEVAVRGNDNGVWTKVRATPSSNWSGWSRVPEGLISSSPSITSSGPGRLDIFARGLDNALWHGRLQNGVLQGWQSLGGIITSEPDATAFDDGQIEVFARGNNGALWRRSWTGSFWTGWNSLGGVLNSGPGAVTRSTNRIDVTVQGTDGSVWHRHFNGSTWSAWAPLGGFILVSPALTTRNGSSLDLVARGPDSHLWRRTFNGASWSGWFRSD